MRIPSLLFVCAVLGSSLSAQDESPYYLQLGFGAVISDNADVGANFGGNISFDPGYLTSLAIGRTFELSDRWNAETEIEALYQYFTVDENDITALPLGAQDDAKSFSVLVNEGLDWKLTPQFGIYGALGVGWAGTIKYRSWDAGTLNTLDDNGLAFQGRLGLDYNFGGSYDFRVGYRFFKTEPIDIEDTQSGDTSQIDVAQHALEIGFRWGL